MRTYRRDFNEDYELGYEKGRRDALRELRENYKKNKGYADGLKNLLLDLNGDLDFTVEWQEDDEQELRTEIKVIVKDNNTKNSETYMAYGDIETRYKGAPDFDRKNRTGNYNKFVDYTFFECNGKKFDDLDDLARYIVDDFDENNQNIPLDRDFLTKFKNELLDVKLTKVDTDILINVKKDRGYNGGEIFNVYYAEGKPAKLPKVVYSSNLKRLHSIALCYDNRKGKFFIYIGDKRYFKTLKDACEFIIKDFEDVLS